MRLRTSSALALFISSVVTIASFVGCNSTDRDVRILGFDPGVADPSAPSFTAPEQDGSADDASLPATPMCIATECPYPLARCPDELVYYWCETNLLTDDRNCGACGNVCPTRSIYSDLNMTSRCIDGSCQAACNVGFQNCNGLIDDGCEANTSMDPDNCGACGNVCPVLSNGSRACVAGECAKECLLTWCGSVCTNTKVDPLNCGACGNECPTFPADAGPPPQGMEYTCQEGQCGQLRCQQPMLDCNGDLELDGCEVDPNTDPKNCGACGKACAPGQVCLYRPEKGGAACACEPTETMCNGRCVDLLSDIYNCGACGNPCPAGANAVAACRNGFCESDCLPGWADCDGDQSCEAKLAVDPRHCGACGNQCDIAAGQPCIDGRCLMIECDAGGPTK